MNPRPTMRQSDLAERPPKVKVPAARLGDGKRHPVTRRFDPALATDPSKLPVGTELGDGLRVGHGGVITGTAVLLSNQQKEAAMPAATAEKPAAKKAPAKKKAATKSKLAKAKEKDNAALAKFLLANVTYGDKTWADRADGKTRRKNEKRDAFIRRVLLGEEEVASEGSTEASA